MAELKYYLVHCTDTPPKMHVSDKRLSRWHMCPKKLPDGKIKYKGEIYKSLAEAPIQPLHKNGWGNGWDRYGYWKIIHRDGSKTYLTQIDDDNFITNDEMTWGAAGVNANAVHVALEGGRLENGERPVGLVDFFDLFTYDQWHEISKDMQDFKKLHQNIIFDGHNRFSRKLCPGFDVANIRDTLLAPQEDMLF